MYIYNFLITAVLLMYILGLEIFVFPYSQRNQTYASLQPNLCLTKLFLTSFVVNDNAVY